jgi:hypothetical protein
MRYDDVFNGFSKHQDLTANNLMDILDAITQVYPMIVLANLTRNSYFMLKDEGFLFDKAMASGNYDAMIEEGVKNIHPHYRSLFLECFSRELLMKHFLTGKKVIEAKIYQKNQQGEYHWVKIRVLRVADESGDIVEICLSQELSHGEGDRYGHQS